MKIPAEIPPKKQTTDKPNGLRLALLSVLALGLLGRTLLANDAKTLATKKSPYASAQGILQEVQSELARTPCRFSDRSIAEARLNEMPALITSWQQTARVEPSELLRSLVRIRETTSCMKTRSPISAEVDRLKSTLEEQLEQDVRSLFARLRRAQREGDRNGAARSFSELQELLKYHDGPLREHLERLRRSYQGL